jgi:hypothetical protein
VNHGNSIYPKPPPDLNNQQLSLVWKNLTHIMHAYGTLNVITIVYKRRMSMGELDEKPKGEVKEEAKIERIPKKVEEEPVTPDAAGAGQGITGPPNSPAGELPPEPEKEDKEPPKGTPEWNEWAKRMADRAAEAARKHFENRG